MQTHDLKTIEQVRADFAARGIPYSAWARANDCSVRAVYDVLLGRLAGKKGEALKVAVLLGLKHGEITDPQQ